MLQRRSRRLAVIFEDQNVLESLVALQIDHPVAERPDHVFHPLDGKVGERRAVLRRLDDHLMRAHAVHLVEHSFGCAVQSALNAQRRKFVGDYAHPPSRRVARSDHLPEFLQPRPTELPDIGDVLGLGGHKKTSTTAEFLPPTTKEAIIPDQRG